MLSDAKIDYKIDFTNLEHNEHVNRLFLLSKQVV